MNLLITIIAGIIVFIICCAIFMFSWNVFAVEVLGMKMISFYQAFAGSLLISATFGAAKASVKNEIKKF